CLAMLCREHRTFSLNHSLHTSIFQVLVDIIWVEGLIDDIYESFDGRNIETIHRCNSMSSRTGIKHGEDGVLLGG
ncbi:hypothetical protein PAXRUDRAFT_164138, partial [Paxillus rubicundulus Ve08.2h10]